MSIKHCRLSKKQQARLLECFVMGVPARTVAALLEINKNTSVYFYHRIREIIARRLEESTPFDGEVEVDESYFGGARKGKRGCGAAGKVPVFGLLKRGDKVYAKMIPNAKSGTLLDIIQHKVLPHSVVYTDGFRGYDVLDVSEFKHYRVNHSEEFVVAGHNHINGIENFWSQAKRHLRKYNGIPKQNFHLFLKECEFRFNYGTPRELLEQLRVWIKWA